MRAFKAVATDRRNGAVRIIEGRATSKRQIIERLRGGGYVVNPVKVKHPAVFDHIMETTNCYPEDWRDNNPPYKVKDRDGIVYTFKGYENGYPLYLTPKHDERHIPEWEIRKYFKIIEQ